jgi:hypothetical protein
VILLGFAFKRVDPCKRHENLPREGCWAIEFLRTIGEVRGALPSIEVNPFHSWERDRFVQRPA